MPTLTNTPRKISKQQIIFWRGIGLSVFVFFGFLISHAVLAQTGGDLGLNEFSGTTNLGTDVSLIGLVARIINIALGFLGVVAIGIILYAGWIWMTSRGDAQKIAKAKKIMVGGVIGLVIILSAYAITAFIIRQLLNATGGGNGGNGWCCGGLPGGNERGFNVVGVDPKNNKTNIPLCRAVQAVFNNDVDPNTITNTTFTIAKDGTPPVVFAGTRTAADNYATFTHKVSDGFTDFEENTKYIATVTTDVKNLAGKNLERQKVWSFTTGTQQDDSLPIVVQASPTAQQGVCRNPAIQAIFDEEMLASTLNHQNIELRDEFNNIIPLKRVSVGSDLKSFTVYAQNTLASNTDFTVTLKTADTTNNPGGIADACSNPLDGNNNNVANGYPADNFTWTFRTGDNTNCAPELTSAVPSSGDYSDQITLNGYNLGITGEVVINNWFADANSFPPPTNNIVSWDDDEIVVRTPVGATTGPWYPQDGYQPTVGKVWVQLATENTNKLDFVVTSPHIIRTSPTSGGPGQWVTIMGWNFGDIPGEVSLNGAPVFAPAACSVDWWKDTRIIVEVPPGATSGDFEIETAGSGSNSPNKQSNGEPFTVNSNSPGPGLCDISPNNTLIGNSIPVTITGESLGANQGSSVLQFGTVTASVNNWTDTQLDLNSPVLNIADTYAVVATVNSRASNALPFNVTNQPGGGGSNIPQVENYQFCTNNTQSPSPYINTINACGNALISARFTTAMAASTLTVGPGQNIYLQQCNNGPAFNDGACSGPGVDFINISLIPGSGSSVIGFMAQPKDPMIRDFWYKGTITTGVTSAAIPPIALPQEYTWHFRVASASCPINSVVVTPPSKILQTIGDTQNFSANATANNCNSISNSDYTWQWTTTNNSSPQKILLPGEPVTQSGTSNPTVTITAQSQTQPNSPAKVRAEALGENKSDDSDVHVSPIMCNTFQDCNLCGPGVSRCIAGLCEPYLLDVQQNNGAIGNWVTINGCYFGNSQGANGRVIYFNGSIGGVNGAWPYCRASNWSNTQIISEVPVGATSGPLTMERNDGVSPLAALNFTVNNIHRPGICNVAPPSHNQSALPANITVDGNGFGASRTPGDDVKYYWSPTFNGTYSYYQSANIYTKWTDKAVVAQTPAVPPTQTGYHRITLIKGGEESNTYNYRVVAAGGGGQGQACDDDPAPLCQRPNDNNCSQGLICNVISCTCEPPPSSLPTIDTVQPFPGQTNVCRNAIVTINFLPGVPINNSTILSSEFKLEGPCRSANVPGVFKNLFAKLKELIWPVNAQVVPPTLCPIAGTLRTSGQKVTFTPSQPMEGNLAGVDYRATITSTKLNCGSSVPSCSWTFRTGPDICAVHSVDITPSSHTFTYAGTPSKSFLAKALAVDGQELGANWAWELDDPSDVVNWENPTQDLSQPNVGVVATNRNGEADLKATATAYSSSASATAPLTVFLCEEPWTYNIDSYDTRLTYCKGKTGDPNLLPHFDGTELPGVGDLQRQYFFKNPTKDEVIGLRIYSNSKRLSPAQWYASRPDITKGSPSSVKIDGYDALRDTQTIYVGAVSRSAVLNSTDLYTNIYVLSFSQGSSAETIGIFNQMVQTWAFNTRADALTKATQSKIQRDLARLQDFELMKSKLASYASTHGNKYPLLRAGTFLQYRTTSIWPSWQAELGNALGSAPPLDPINKALCPAQYNQNTCWNASATPRFYCDAGSYIYQYKIGNGALGYALNANMEYKPVTWKGSPPQIPDIPVLNVDDCDSFDFRTGSYVAVVEDEDIPETYPPFIDFNLNVYGSPVNDSGTVNLVWTSGRAGGSGEDFHYELWRTNDVPGFSPNPAGWQAIVNPIPNDYQYYDVPPGQISDGGWWYKVRIVSDEASNPSPTKESQPKLVVKDSTAPAAPTCTPPPGTYTDPQSVRCSVSASDDNSTANVHYTTGSFDPTCGSPVFANPTNINSTTTLRLISCDAANNKSAVVTATYTIEAPATTANLYIDAKDSVTNQPLNGIGVSVDTAPQFNGTTPLSGSSYPLQVNLGNYDVNFSIPPSLSCYNAGSIDPPQGVVLIDSPGNYTVIGNFDPRSADKATSPTPPDNQGVGLGNIPVDITLSWVANCATKFNVYLAKSTDPLVQVATGITNKNYKPSPSLEYSTAYRWRIDSINSANIVTTGTVWQFTTEAAPTSQVTFTAQPPQARGDFVYIDSNIFDGDISPVTSNPPVGTEFTTTLNYGNYDVQYANTKTCWDLDRIEQAGTPINGTIAVDQPTTTVTGIYNIALPQKATNVSPIDITGSGSVPSTQLQWAPGSCGVDSYDIWFGTNQNALVKQNSVEYTNTTYTVATPNYSTQYFWRVDTVNSSGTTQGDVWSFTTLSAPIVITLRSQDSVGTNPPPAGANVTVLSGTNTIFTGTTQTATPQIAQGSYTVNFGNLNCHTLVAGSGATNPPGYNNTQQNYTGNTTVTGIYDPAPPPPVTNAVSPAAANVPISPAPVLQWNSVGTCATSYQVRFNQGTAITSGVLATINNPGPYTYSPTPAGGWQYDTDYTWRVDSVYKGLVRQGTPFTFRTAAAPLWTVNITSTRDGTPTTLTGAPFTFDSNNLLTNQTFTSAANSAHTLQFNNLTDNGTVCFSSNNSAVQNIVIDSNPKNFVGAYTRQAPQSITSPLSPGQGATNVPITPTPPTLSWNAANCATQYQVYFGTTNPPPSVTTINDTGANQYSYSPSPTGGWQNGTTYYWRVVPINNGINSTGTVFSFTTTSVYQVNIKSKHSAPGVSAPWYFTGAPVSINTTPPITGNTEVLTPLGQVPAGNYTVTYSGSVGCTTLQTPTVPINVTGPSGTIILAEGIYAVNPPDPTTPRFPNNGLTNVSTNVTLQWNGANCTINYAVYFGTDQNNLSIVPTCAGITSTSCPVSGLTPNTQYYWKVVGLSYGTLQTTSPSTGAWSFTTSPPPAVTITATSQLHQGTNYTNFPVQARLDGTYPGGTYLGITPTGITLPGGVSHEITFYYNDPQNGCYEIESISPPQPMTYNTSTTVTATWREVATPPKATYSGPQNGWVFPRTTTWAQLNWNEVICASGYRVYKSNDGINWTILAVVSPYTTTSWTYSPLSAGNTYYWRVDPYKGSNVRTGDVMSFSVAP